MIAARGRGIALGLASLVLGVVLGGCSTVDTRIAEHPEVFASLDPQTRAKLVAGVVELGYTMAMVYIAYGGPNEVHRSAAPEPGSPERVTWVYQYAYPAYDDYFDYYDPFGYPLYHRYHGRYYLYSPYYYPRYRYEYRDYRRVVFERGRVVRVEEVR